jgi:hypothetical protein
MAVMELLVETSASTGVEHQEQGEGRGAVWDLRPPAGMKKGGLGAG